MIAAAITASAPGVLADLLAAALNQQAMLWRTSPAATELEAVTLGWLRQLIGLPDTFEGVIYDTASISTMHALAAAREAAVRRRARAGLAARATCRRCTGVPLRARPLVGRQGGDCRWAGPRLACASVPTEAEFRMRPDLLAAMIASDRAAGRAAASPSSPRSAPRPRPASIRCRRSPTSARARALAPRRRRVRRRRRRWCRRIVACSPAPIGPTRSSSTRTSGCSTPFDLSAFYCRRMDVLRAAFALTPEYLRRASGAGEEPDGHRRAARTPVPRAEALDGRSAPTAREAFASSSPEAHRLAQQLARWIDDHPDFERLAPVPFSVVCFRWAPPRWLSADERTLPTSAARRPSTPPATCSSRTHASTAASRCGMAIGHERTTETHVQRAWQLVQDCAPR